MQNKENIKVFMLGFGANIKVIESKWLIDDIQNETQTIKRLY
jgi:hypothetical protein